MKTNKVQIEHKLPSECTTIIIGQEQTADGSMIVARSEDWDAMEAKNYEIFEDTDMVHVSSLQRIALSVANSQRRLWATLPFLRIIFTVIGAVLVSTRRVWE